MEGQVGMGVKLKEKCLLEIEWNIQILQKSMFTNPHGCGVGVSIKIVFSKELHEMSRTAHKIHVWQHYPHGARGGSWGTNSCKTFMNQWNVQNYTKLIFSFLAPTQVWAQFTKNLFAGNVMKCSELHINLMFGSLHPMGTGVFWWKLYEIFETA